MSSFFVLVGFIGFVLGIFWLFRKTKRKRGLIVIAVGFVLFLIGGALAPENEEAESTEEQEEIISEEAEKQEEENNSEEVDKQEKKTESGSKKKTNEDKKKPKKENKNEIPNINEDAINHAYDIINGYDMVKDSNVTVSQEDKKIILAIQVNSATNEKHAKDLGDNFTRALSSGASIYSEDDLRTPSKDDLGEIYDYYDLQVGVGTGSDNFIVRGAKVTSSLKITW